MLIEYCTNDIKGRNVSHGVVHLRPKELYMDEIKTNFCIIKSNKRKV